jgi:yeast amino acid transporter
LGKTGRAPTFLGRTNKRGVPVPAIIFSNLFASICFVNLASGGVGAAYTYLINLSGVSTFIVRAVIALTHIQFRRGLKAQDVNPNQLPFRAVWYPYGAYFALGANLFLILFQGYSTLFPKFDPVSFVVAYILILIFFLLYFGYKFSKKTKWISASEMDIWSNRRVFTETEINRCNVTILSRLKSIFL